MSPQDRQPITESAPDDAPEAARLIRDFPGWQIRYESAGVWSAERKLSCTHVELHCAHDLDELRSKLVRVSL
jgi:hypothetical protein